MFSLPRLVRISRVYQRALCTIREPGVVGLPADENPRQTLVMLYKKTLEAVKDVPGTASYRTNVEKITKYRMDVVSNNEDIETIEAVLNVGQMPEIIEQAQDELQLIDHMKQWQPWDKPRNVAVIEVVE